MKVCPEPSYLASFEAEFGFSMDSYHPFTNNRTIGALRRALTEVGGFETLFTLGTPSIPDLGYLRAEVKGYGADADRVTTPEELKVYSRLSNDQEMAGTPICAPRTLRKKQGKMASKDRRQRQ